MRILFIRPNKDTLGYKPIGISLLSALSKREGHEVRLFDTTFFDFGFEELSDQGSKINKFKQVDFSQYNMVKVSVDLEQELFAVLQEYQPDLCAFSVLSDEVYIARDISVGIKRWNPDLPVIWGGIYPTVDPEEAISTLGVDYICVGEGIEAFPEFVHALDKKEDATQIKNIYAKMKINGDEVVFRNECRPLFETLDELPYLDWDIFDRRHFYKPYDGRIVVSGDYMSNWGCPYKCTYCINNYLNQHTGKRVIRRFSPERAVAELKYLKEKYGLNFFRFCDEDFMMRPMEHLTRLAELYVRDVALPFVIEGNSKSTTAEKVRILKEMGIASVSLAIETGNEYIRKEILGRADTLEDVVAAFDLFNAEGVRTSAFNMLGLPFEDRKAIFDTIEINRRARPTIADCGFFFPFVATELYDVSIKNGFYNKEEVPIYRNDYPALDQPTLRREELMGLQKCFSLYVKFPQSYYPLIERAEKNDEAAQEIFMILSSIFERHVFAKGGYFAE